MSRRFVRNPFANAGERAQASRFGMWLFLASLGMLFAATLVAFLVLRLQIGSGWPALPPLPKVIWISTGVIILSSMILQSGVWATRRNNMREFRVCLVITLVLGVLFLALQAMAWLQWLPAAIDRWDMSNEWRFALTVFYIFTTLHALHVIGGLIPITVLTIRTLTSNVSSMHQSAINSCAMYWHFLGVVWIALFVALMIGV